MKKKFRSMGRVAMALVLALSLVMVMAVPVSAAVSGITVTLDPTMAGTDAEYTVVFTTTEYLMEGTSDKIYIEFPAGTDITGYDGTVTIGGVADNGVTVSDQVLAITVPAAGDIEPGEVTVVIPTGGTNNITNPPAGDYTLDVWTNEEPTHVVSNSYTITLLAIYLTVTGTATTMDAGGTIQLTVRAYDAGGSVETAYEGSKTLVFSGPGVAPDGTAPTVGGTTMEEEMLTVNFTSGVSDPLLDLVAFKAEETTVDVSDGTIDSTGDAAYDLDLTVDPDTAAGLAYTVKPASVTAGVETTVFTVQRQDDWANPVTSGETTVDLASDASGDDEEFRATAGGDPETDVTIAALDSTVDFYYYDELAGDWTITASFSLFNTISTLTVDPAAIDHYTVEAITSSQVTNTVFPVTIQAEDEFNNDITSGGDAAEDITLAYNKADAGATPSSFTTEAGTATEDVTLTATTLGQSITFTGGTSGKTVTSSPFQVIAAVTVWVDVTNGLDDNPGTEASPFKTIAKGITEAGVNGTVNVLPGTYEPGAELTIADNGLTLQGANYGVSAVTGARGPESTIDFGGSAVAIVITGDDVTVDGFTVVNADIFFINVLGANAIVQNNIFRLPVGYEQIALNSGSSGARVLNNDFAPHISMLVSGSLSGITLSLNNFGGGINLQASGDPIEDLVITDNQLIGSEDVGIKFEYGSFDDILIQGNTISETTLGSGEDAAIAFLNAVAAVTNLTITENDITDNLGGGIRIGTGPWGVGNTIYNNNISGNVNFGGIDNNSGISVNADNNWWGDASGPWHTTDNNAAAGDNVSDDVDYTPWLTAAYGVEEVTSISLESGWNFISVPKSMADDTDTFGELLAGIDVVVAYSYDPGSGWSLALDDADPVEVLEGYWIEVNTAGTITLSYKEGAQQVPAFKSLVGDAWNAIGFSNTTARDADTALMSVVGSWSTILGWDAEGQAYEDSIIVGETGDMLPGKGYWIWMTEDDVLSAISG